MSETEPKVAADPVDGERPDVARLLKQHLQAMDAFWRSTPYSRLCWALLDILAWRLDSPCARCYVFVCYVLQV